MPRARLTLALLQMENQKLEKILNVASWCLKNKSVQVVWFWKGFAQNKGSNPQPSTIISFLRYKPKCAYFLLILTIFGPFSIYKAQSRGQIFFQKIYSNVKLNFKSIGTNPSSLRLFVLKLWPKTGHGSYFHKCSSFLLCFCTVFLFGLNKK